MNQTFGALALGAGLLACAAGVIPAALAQTADKPPPSPTTSLGTGSTAKSAPGGTGSVLGNGGAYTGADSTGAGGAPTGNGQTGTSAQPRGNKQP